MEKNVAKSKKSNKKKYDPSSIEPKWQSVWKKDGVYQPDLSNANRPFYNLMMFPYPSAEGLHVGNMYAQTGSDIYGRFKRMQGYDVFEPIGLDGFGIHSENYALKVGTHPKEQAAKSEENFYKQMHAIGTGVDWSRTVETYNPDYYKWTQWLFIQFFNAGLAYKAKSPVNFCPSCKTVLADEQVIEGRCERCDTVVEKRELEQWFFKITKYAERLLNNIDSLNWTEKVKTAQRNWIGKSEGARITFRLKNIPGQKDNKHSVEVFTTRPDTIHGATFIVISPELAQKWITIGWKAPSQVISYVEEALNKSEMERASAEKEKTGVFTEILATNPINNKEIPVWVADYVLGGYGTGAIMAVPAHDQRDFDFAKKYDLEIVQVIAGKEEFKETAAYAGQGILINSGEWNGWKMPSEMSRVLASLEEKGAGRRETNYHLRDWLISRQRYWGPPIPMLYCEDCAKNGYSWFTLSEEQKKNFGMGISNFSHRDLRQFPISNEKWQMENAKSSHEMAGWYPVSESGLPVVLPDVEDWKPKGEGTSPLANIKDFVETTCPKCGGEARRETDVSDTFLDSAWYFLRYLATDWDDMPFPSAGFASSKKQEARNKDEIESANWAEKIENSSKREVWLPVTMYFGGAEHSVLHLLYARFVTMVLKDLGHIEFEEPFARFYAHGLIIKDGAKMSKSKGNVVVPDAYIKKFGADTLRTYLMFLGPVNQGGDFRDTGIEGMNRFLKRVWTLFSESRIKNPAEGEARQGRQESRLSAESLKIMHKTIKGVTQDLEELRYNTAIAKLMIWYNFLSKQDSFSREEAENYLKLLAPFAPHMTEEIWQEAHSRWRMADTHKTTSHEPRATSSIHVSSWPVFDESALVEKKVILPVQVNGKLRATIEIDSVDVTNREKVEQLARQSDAMKFIEGQTVKTVVYIPAKVLNFVLG